MPAIYPGTYYIPYLLYLHIYLVHPKTSWIIEKGQNYDFRSHCFLVLIWLLSSWLIFSVVFIFFSSLLFFFLNRNYVFFYFLPHFSEEINSFPYFRDIRAKLEVAINKCIEVAEQQKQEAKEDTDTEDYSSDSDEVSKLWLMSLLCCYNIHTLKKTVKKIGGSRRRWT